jgi:hypothetical protein
VVVAVIVYAVVRRRQSPPDPRSGDRQAEPAVDAVAD